MRAPFLARGPLAEGAAAAPALWCDAGPEVSREGLGQLLEALAEARPGLGIVLTGGEGAAWPGRVRLEERPADSRGPAERFFAAQGVQAVIFTGARSHDAAIGLCEERRLPVLAVEARAPGKAGLAGLLRAPRRRRIDRVLAADAGAAEAYLRGGADPARVETAGLLAPVVPPLACDEREREVLAGLLKARPVWFAAGICPEEAPLIEAAMRRAIRLSHRLLLVVAPVRPGEIGPLADRFGAAGWRLARRDAGEDPSDGVQVCLADLGEEAGLWYRLAPVTFLGGTLAGGPGPVHPFDPGRLGSAVIHGPGPVSDAAALRRLTRARASRRVRDAGELGEAVLELLSPERAALLARRAWDETTIAAAVQTRALEAILEALDAARA